MLLAVFDQRGNATGAGAEDGVLGWFDIAKDGVEASCVEREV